MDFEPNPVQGEIRDAVMRLCADFPDGYWEKLEAESAYPEEFVNALTDAGWLSVLIPEAYGGGGGTLADAAAILQAVNESGANGAAAHAQMYTMGTLLRHGSEEQKEQFLPLIASGELRLQAFGVTEPDAGSDTTRIATMARLEGENYVVNGSKIWTSRFQHSDLLLLLVRTTPYEDVVKKSDGLSILLVDLREIDGEIEARPIPTMVNHETNELFINNLIVPRQHLIGNEGDGFRYILSSLNAERILVASELIGDGFWFVRRASEYASQRHVFGRPIGSNQGVQFPIAEAYADLEASALLRSKAAWLFDNGEQPGFEANAAKLLAAKAAWAAANAAMDTFGGFGMAREYGLERKFRDVRLLQIAPVGANLILAYIAHKVLGMPRSY